MRFSGPLAGAALLLGAFSVNAQDAPAPPAPFQGTELGEGPWDFDSSAGPIHAEVIARGIDHPWGMAFTPDGDILVTERPGRLRVIRDGMLDPQPIGGLPEVYALGIAGLTDIALHPDFADNRLVYLSYSKTNPDNADEQALAVMRARWDGSATLTYVEDIFVARPWYGAKTQPERCCGQGPAFGSFGGRLLFDDDGFLFVTSGDRNHGMLVQETDNHFGKILRLTDTGDIPRGNPWYGWDGHVSEVWSTGHRNPLGLTINPVTGEMWESEFGPRGGDEVNRILRGGNYGWMQVTQGQHYDGTPAEGVKNVDGMIDPVLVYGPPSLNPGNLAFYTGSQMDGWYGDMLLASFTKGLLHYETDVEGRPVGEPEYLLQDLGQRWRDVRNGPDGAIWLLTDQANGAVIRLSRGG